MFSRKEQLPKLPEPPTVEAMLQDIKDASDNDPIFKLTFENESVNNGNSTRNSSLSDEDETSDNEVTSRGNVSHADAAYEKMRLFIEQNCQMKDIVETLPTLCEQLNKASSDLSHSLQSSKEKMLNKTV